MTVTVEFDPRARRRRQVAAALLNASGVGLGFIYLRMWGRALAYWLLTGVLLSVANAVNAADSPVVWLVVYALWLLAAVASGWRLGGRRDKATVGASLLAPVAGLVAIATAATGLVLYRAIPASELDKGEKAHAAGDCAAAIEHYDRAAASRYEFTLSPAPGDAREGRDACGLLLSAEQEAGNGNYAAAAADYAAYLDTYAGGSPPFADATARLTAARLDAADAAAEQAAESGAWQGAGGYLDAFEAYFSLRADHPDSAEAAEVAGRVEGIYDEHTTAFTRGRFCEATDDLRPFAELADHFDEPEARDIDERADRSLAEATYGCANSRLDGASCEVVEEFRSAARMPGATKRLAERAREAAFRAQYACGAGHRDAGRDCEAVTQFEAVAGEAQAPKSVAGQADDALREALYDCGRSRYEDGSYGEARSALRQLLDDYPNHARAGEAEDLLIAIDIAEISDGNPGELPDPNQAGVGAAGVSTVEIENGSSETLEILYTGPETGRTTIEACGGCTGTLSLTPGSYEVVARASSDSSVVPFYGTWELSSGYIYSNYFYITFY